jgi:hypothetical protein
MCRHATFVELPAFERHRERYLDDEGYRSLQCLLLARPDSGDVVAGSGGLRKLRFKDARRAKGKRGGLRVIYYFWMGGPEFWLYLLYDKDELSDLTPSQWKTLKLRLKAELLARNNP